jgi:ubiquinone/menaquinone biosynthesis C-methylase UbiE
LNAFEELFLNLDGGSVLDVATGEGGYISILQRYLKRITSIVGIDLSIKVLNIARKANENSDLHFVQMDAVQLGFETGFFDTVNISASLHHLENTSRVLKEMKRVLKPGGKFILTEMHRDGATTAQFNAVRIHHWAAAVDSSLGYLHDRTFARDEILDFLDELSLTNMIIRDFPNIDSDPMDGNPIKSHEAYLDKYVQRAQKAAGADVLIQQSEELRRSLHEKGLQREPVLIVVAEKP